MSSAPSPAASKPAPTIGVFDSGFGGLTVLRELLPLIPGAHYIYLGDTARLPYGSKSRETIVRYAVESARFLHDHGAEMLVIACNTATALALDEINAALPIPVVGVVDPGAHAARAATRAPGEVLVLATAATVDSHAYARACAALGLQATEKACPLLVPLVEEGWIQGSPGEHPSSPVTSATASGATSAVTSAVLRIYLTEALAAAPASQTLLLGCTHYPLLRPMIAEVLATLSRPLTIIDSAEATAHVVASLLQQRSSHAPARLSTRTSLSESEAEAEATYEFFATDSVAKFERLGSRFLGRPLGPVQLVDLGG